MTCSTRVAESDRFWSKVDKCGPVPAHVPEVGRCWVWTSTLKGTYGSFRRAKTRGAMERAHRVAWEMTYGPIPDGLWVLHRCDNRLCVRPDHLFLGSRQDNMDDMHAKGRGVPLRGERNGCSKLTEIEVREIRRLLGMPDRPSYREMARRFGVSRPVIQAIHQGRAWRHVAALPERTA